MKILDVFGLLSSSVKTKLTSSQESPTTLDTTQAGVSDISCIYNVAGGPYAKDELLASGFFEGVDDPGDDFHYMLVSRTGTGSQDYDELWFETLNEALKVKDHFLDSTEPLKVTHDE